MDIAKRSKNSYAITGTYEEMLAVASLFRKFDPRAWPFYTAANLATTHDTPEVSTTDLSSKRLEVIASKLEQRRSSEIQPIAIAIRNTLSDPGHIYQPEL